MLEGNRKTCHGGGYQSELWDVRSFRHKKMTNLGSAKIWISLSREC